MQQSNISKNEEKQAKETGKKDDILDVVKQFISYFEETDRSENNDYSIYHS